MDPEIKITVTHGKRKAVVVSSKALPQAPGLNCHNRMKHASELQIWHVHLDGFDRHTTPMKIAMPLKQAVEMAAAYVMPIQKEAPRGA